LEKIFAGKGVRKRDQKSMRTVTAELLQEPARTRWHDGGSFEHDVLSGQMTYLSAGCGDVQ